MDLSFLARSGASKKGWKSRNTDSVSAGQGSLWQAAAGSLDSQSSQIDNALESFLLGSEVFLQPDMSVSDPHCSVELQETSNRVVNETLTHSSGALSGHEETVSSSAGDDMGFREASRGIYSRDADDSNSSPYIENVIHVSNVEMTDRSLDREAPHVNLSLLSNRVSQAQSYGTALKTAFDKLDDRDGNDILAVQRVQEFQRIVLHNNISFRGACDFWDYSRASIQSSDQKAFGKGYRSLAPAYEMIGLAAIPIQNVSLSFAGQLRRDIPAAGIPTTLYYRETLQVIIRRVLEILRMHGEKVFEIKHAFDSANNRIFTWPQNGDFLMRVRQTVRMHLPQSDGLLIIPVKLHVDEAQMKTNGLHPMTPVSISIMHEKMLDPFTLPTVLAYIPELSLDKAEAVLGTTSSLKKLSADLKCSLTHAVLKFLLESLLFPGQELNETILREKTIRIPSFESGSEKMFNILPVLFNVAADMPQVSYLSFTKRSSFTQAMPCQVCQIAVKDWYDFEKCMLTPKRSEAKTISILEAPNNKNTLNEYNIRQLRPPYFCGSNPWTTEGLFLFMNVDRLHGIQSGLLRGLASIGLTLVFLFEESVQLAVSTSEARGRDVVVHIRDDLEQSCEEDSTDEPARDDLAYCSTGDSSVELAPKRRRSATRRSSSRANRLVSGASISHPERKGKTPLEEASLAVRVRRLRESARGQILRNISKRIRREWTITIPRRHSVRIPIRLDGNCMDILSKSCEQKYSLGLLLEVMVAVASDQRNESMGLEFRREFLETATLAVIFYMTVSDMHPTEDTVQRKIPELARRLFAAVESLKLQTRLKWDPPKLHHIVHYSECIQWFGRIRNTDTCEGENSMKLFKVGYSRLAPHRYKNATHDLLQYMEKRDMIDFTGLCLQARTESASSLSANKRMQPHTPSIVHFVGRVRFSIFKQRSQLYDLGLPAAWLPPHIAPYHTTKQPSKCLSEALDKYLACEELSWSAIQLDFFSKAKINFSDGQFETISAGIQSEGLQFDFACARRRDQIEEHGMIYCLCRLRTLNECKETMGTTDFAFIRLLKRSCFGHGSMRIGFGVNACICLSCSPLLRHCHLTESFALLPLELLCGRLTSFKDVSSDCTPPQYFTICPKELQRMEIYS